MIGMLPCLRWAMLACVSTPSDAALARFRPLVRRILPCALAALLAAAEAETALNAAEIAAAGVQLAQISDSDREFFEARIRPLFVSHCLECHGPAKQKASLRLDSRGGIVAGGESGPVLEPAKPEDSRLIRAVGYADPDLQMPPKGKLSEVEIADLARWVRAGAAWPNDAEQGKPDVAPSGDSGPKKDAFDLAGRKAAHWAWRPVRAESPPAVEMTLWPRQPLDAFVLSKLEAAKLSPAQFADRRTLIRRASFDLVGLPPTPAEVEAFVNDASPAAWAAVVDRLLESPRFGERWARHWLDLARYAETRGHEFDYEIPNAFQYRDYVIRAFNADVPYDQFVIEHVAGDLVERPRTDPSGETNESVIATGFWWLGEWMHSPVDIRQDELDRVDNQIDVFGKTFLGLTIACARCHDHKFDAISARDYYALAGYLHSSSYRDTPFQHQAHNRAVADRVRAFDSAATTEIARRLATAASPVVDHLADYLLATRDVLVAAPAPQQDVAKSAEPTNETDPAAMRARFVQRAASERGLDAGALANWVEEISTHAAADALHPLHPWAVAASKAGADSGLEPRERFAQWLRDPLELWRQEQARSLKPSQAQSIVDYRRIAADQWIADGVAFGAGPQAAGAWHWGESAEQPLGWRSIQPVADSAGLGAVNVNMLRSPTFVVTEPVASCLLRGSVDVFVVIDSHRMIAGPLHGSTKKHFESTEWKWLNLDLARYLGQRAHIEFRPAAPSRELAVAACVQGPEAQIDPSRVATPLLEALSEPRVESLVDLANRYQRAFASARQLLAAEPTALAAEQQTLVEWIAQRPKLFGAVGPTQTDFSQRFAEQQAARKKLLSGFRESATAMALLDGTGFDERLLLRGSPKTPGPVTPRRNLEALGGLDQPTGGARSGRLELARRLVDPANPLVSRVLVNRVWHHLFGRGIVASTDNFGVLGSAPSHPELLDHLTDKFVQDGWSVKRLLRMIMTSSTYQMASRGDAASATVDPQNLLLSRANFRRLEGEPIRDTLLTLAGVTDLSMFGPSIEVYLPAYVEGMGRPKTGPLDGAGRRTVYTKVRRNFLPTMQLAFDMPAPFSSMGRRSESNVPAQALILLNDPLVIQLAEQWGKRALASPDQPANERIRQMYLEAFAREPLAEELSAGLAFLERDGELRGLKPQGWVGDAQVWADFAHVLINTKEFIYIN